MKQPTYWCVFDAKGLAWPITTAGRRWVATYIALNECPAGTTWRKLRRRGFTVRRVRIVEVEKE